MRITAALSGDLNKIMLQERRDAAIGVTKGITEATVGLKNDLRRHTELAGLGRRLPKTWRSKIFPTGQKKSTGAAGFVFSKAPKLLTVFSQNNVIKARRKKFLALPTENVPLETVRGGAKRPIPALRWNSSGAESSFGPLHLVSRRGKTPVLIANLISNVAGTRARFGTEKQRARGRRRVSVIMYVLVKTVRLPRKINIDNLAEKWADQIDEQILKNYPKTKQGPIQFKRDILGG